jgi:LmbE family N-acetylglucosaminyl deacetylase
MLRDVSDATAETMTAETMQAWGRVEPGALDRIVVVSPHLDDAVLGCGRLLAAHPGATVVTVFAGPPDRYPDPPTAWDTLAGFGPGDDVLASRRAEDAAALAVVAAQPVWLDHVEHQYLPRAQWLDGPAVADALEAAVREARPTAVFAPFGLGNPDHEATHLAARIVRARLPEPVWFCYEDTGYKHVPGLLARRVAQLLIAGDWPTPAAVPLDPEPGRARAALDCYASQLLALEADWALAAKLAAPAPEQHWRLASPPAGWERLAAPAALGLPEPA